MATLAFNIAPNSSGLDTLLPYGGTQPDITVTGTVVDRASVTITTSTLHFGATGPTQILDYTAEDEAVGALAAPVGLNGATITPTSGALVLSDTRGTSKAVRASLNVAGSYHYLRIDFPSTWQEFFYSYTFKPADCWPCNDMPNWSTGQPVPGEIPNDSAWKFNWIQSVKGDSGTSNSNLCLPTHASGQVAIGQGNTHTMISAPLIDLRESIEFNDWNTLEAWAKVGTTPTAADGTAYVSLTSEKAGTKQKSGSGAMFGGAGGRTTYVYDQLPGWIDVNNRADIRVVDYYYAQKPARVVVGDHPVWLKVRRKAHCYVTSWADQSISCELRFADIPSTRPKFLFVFDSNNNQINSVGKLLNAGVL